MLQTMIEARGMQVRAVPSAEAAIKALDAQLPDIIVSDIGMPVEDGFSLMRRIQRDRGEAMSAGYQEHVAKPFDPADLVARVAQLRRSR